MRIRLLAVLQKGSQKMIPGKRVTDEKCPLLLLENAHRG
jgi:hypothetical protein